MNVLLIGCGSISALYDWDTNEVKTHCKALSKLPNTLVSVYDNDFSLSQKVALKYKFSCIENEKDIILNKYQWVVIASSTNSHFYWLSKCFNAAVPLIICEKPLAKTKEELDKLEMLYNKGNSKVVVNFIRRFHPAYAQLKNDINNIAPTNIIIKYQRGLINNFSHAADLLNYLFGEYLFKNIQVTQCIFDEFEDDPTISFNSFFNKIPINVIGLAGVKYSYFEIELFFEDKKISVINNGNDIIYQKSLPFEAFYKPLPAIIVYKENNLLDNYMQFVYDSVIQVYKNIVPDNYVEAIKMNQQLLQLIQ